GCELAYHGELPKAGETLQYDIHVDGHAQQGDVRLFFFHYNCRVNGELRLSVRGGQAGFFTDQELLDSGGVLWSPEDETIAADLPLDLPAVRTQHTSFSRAQLEAFADGRPFDCFGPGFETTQAHSCSPRVGQGRMLLPDVVTHFQTDGGHWGRGYLRAEQKIQPDDWFFDGHFKNDPCMPGTLMFEGCLQTLSLYLGGIGYTIDRDGWRFQPVTDERYLMRCRGQVIPTSDLLIYEVFVREIIDGPEPVLYADVLCTVDGLKAFHAGRVGMRLVPDWPLDYWRDRQPRSELIAANVTREDLPALGGMVGYTEPKPVAVVDGFPFDYNSLIACGWGRPSEAFGPFYQRFDTHRRVARLPGPPYHFMSRITEIDGEIGCMKAGISVTAEYDIPAECWYFAGNGAPVMPLAVLMEAALQPCGWLSSYLGGALSADHDLLFRNLDGTGTMHAEITPGNGPLVTRVKLLSLAQSAGMLIVNFEVTCHIADTLVFDMKTVFGFFPTEAFEDQAGLPSSADEKAYMAAKGTLEVDLTARPAEYCTGSVRLADPMLLMLDRITDWQPTGGSKGLGKARGEKTVDPAEWFFKAHFFQDPVQPGSLGIEAMAQLLQWVMLERGMAAGIDKPRFEPIMVAQPLTWKYRGQVVPSHGLIQSELDLTETGTDEHGAFAIADCALWVDGKRIYHAKGMGMRIVSGGGHDDTGYRLPSPTAARTRSERPIATATPGTRARARKSGGGVSSLDPESDHWLNDHRPTWTVPTLPMMSMADLLAGAFEGGPVTRITDLQARTWLRFDGEPRKLQITPADKPDSPQNAANSGDQLVSGDSTSLALQAWRDAPNPNLSRFETIATGRLSAQDVGPAPTAWAPLSDSEAADAGSPYAVLFHGPAFQCLTGWRVGQTGASATLDAGRLTVPHGTLGQGLLDAMTHVIPHDDMTQWSEQIPAGFAAYPHRLVDLQLFAPLPRAGLLRLEARFVGFDDEAASGQRYPTSDVQLISDHGGVIATMRLVEVLLPKGRIGNASPEARRRFLAGQFVPDVGLTTAHGTATRLELAEIRTLDWLPGTVSHIYDLHHAHQANEQVAVKEHVSRLAAVHPANVSVSLGQDGHASARAMVRPFRRYDMQLTADPGALTVTQKASPVADWQPAKDFWRAHLQVGPWPVEDLLFGLVSKFVRDVVVIDPSGLRACKRCIFVANHQVGIESLLFSLLAAALTEAPVVTVAKTQHRGSWLGRLIQACFSHPDVTDPGVITFFDRANAASLLELTASLSADLQAGRRNVMVHVAGTRALAAGAPVTAMASTFIDLAVATGAALVPVRFVGGLPELPAAERLDFPVGFGAQDYWIGQPIPAAVLSSLPLKERRDLVLGALNHLGPALPDEQPLPADPAFGAQVQQRQAAGLSEASATLQAALAQVPNPSAATGALWAQTAAGQRPADAWLAKFGDAIGLS
ncbi:MAG: polyketide synthase dehydratase domain-containing protein, partial [Myxococcales bacterium]|nr:polyketide synthase dehydratase domain-containing protein [Myxococcales bacterium]